MEVTQEINEICAELLERYKQEVKNTGHYASGELANTASYITKWDGRYFELYFNLQEYWRYLENGTKPHFPPVDAIQKWVEVKPVIPRAISNRVPTTKQLAFLIARGISKNGTKPLKLLDDTLNNSSDLLDRIAEEFEKQLQEEINNEEI